MNVSVVIATYNRCDSLRRCLHAVVAQTLPPLEVIVVDDASTDATVQMVEQEFPAVKMVSSSANRGPAVARNAGIRLASGDLVAFTDDDCVPPDNWLASLVAGFREFPGVVGVSGYQEAGDELVAHNAVAQADRVMRLQSSGSGAEHVQQGGEDLPGFGTNNVAYLREALVAVGGFDESFVVASGEDTDLKVRICRATQQWPTTPPQGPLLYLPLKVRHDRSYSLRAQWRLGFKRGIGAYHFESIHARPPGLGRIFLRFGIRTLRLMRDLWQQPVAVAFVIYLTRLSDCCGQLQMALSRYGDEREVKAEASNGS